MENEENKPGKSRKVLIVEDNDNVAKLIARSLANEGFETKVISYGSAATFYAMENGSCLLLMEYQLPDMTAKEVIANLQGSRQEIPFIIMSSPGNEKRIIEMMKLGARDYLVKEQGFLDLLPASVKRVFQQLETEDLLAQRERDLQVSEDKFGNIFNSISDAIFIYDFQGKLLTVNKAACNLLGTDEKKLTGTSFLELLPEEFNKKFGLYLADLRDQKRVQYDIEFTGSFGKQIPVECISRLIDYDDSQAILTIAHDISERKEVENMLCRSEERLQRIANALSDYIYTVFVNNGKPEKTVHSPACQKITGYTVEEFAAHPFLWIEIVDERDREFVLQKIERIISGEQMKPYEHRIIRKDGKPAWLRNTPVLHFNDRQELVSYDGVVEEITERKEAERELLEKKAQLSAIIEAFEGLIYVCSPDYRIEYMNDKFLERTGYDPVGELCFKALHDLEEKCPWCVNDRVQKGETMKWEVNSPKDNHWYSVINTPIFHHDGRISKQAMIIDISDKKFADQELNRLNSLYFNLLKEIDRPVCRFLTDGSIISANQAFQEKFDCLPDLPLEDQSVFSCVPPELSAWTKKILPSLDGDHRSERMKVKRVKGDKNCLENKVWVVMVILDPENDVLEYQGMLRNE